MPSALASDFTQCAVDACLTSKTQLSCSTRVNCGWCSDAGVGRCVSGSAAAPTHGYCSLAGWKPYLPAIPTTTAVTGRQPLQYFNRDTGAYESLSCVNDVPCSKTFSIPYSNFMDVVVRIPANDAVYLKFPSLQSDATYTRYARQLTPLSAAVYSDSDTSMAQNSLSNIFLSACTNNPNAAALPMYVRIVNNNGNSTAQLEVTYNYHPGFCNGTMSATHSREQQNWQGEFALCTVYPTAFRVCVRCVLVSSALDPCFLPDNPVQCNAQNTTCGFCMSSTACLTGGATGPDVGTCRTAIESTTSHLLLLTSRPVCISPSWSVLDVWYLACVCCVVFVLVSSFGSLRRHLRCLDLPRQARDVHV